MERIDKLRSDAKTAYEAKQYERALQLYDEALGECCAAGARGLRSQGRVRVENEG
jgi:hypothetical protein